jgi:hypothetical protein
MIGIDEVILVIINVQLLYFHTLTVLKTDMAVSRAL